MLALALDDIPCDGIQQSYVGAHSGFEVGLKNGHIVGDDSLNLIHPAHVAKVHSTSRWRGHLYLLKIPPMIYSMTGYGKSTASIGEKQYTAEIRSLNSKQLDLSVRIPSAFREKEMELRKVIGAALVRGKCDLLLHYVSEGTERRELNLPIIHSYLDDLEGVAKSRGYDALGEGALNAVMRLPDVLQQSKEELDEQEWSAVWNLIQDALAQFEEFRVNEGKSLEQDLRDRVASIQQLEASLDPLIEERITRIRERIQTNFEEIQDRGRLDENRFEQEVLFYIEKLDVSEERVRLIAHCQHFIEVLEQATGQGKKLGFIAQEMGREINTLGSKANDAEVQRIVVHMKDELEKIKEQVLNAL